MLTVAQSNYIKDIRENEDANVSEIARRLKINWRTAKKYADEECEHQQQPTQQRERQVMGAEHEERLRTWLAERFAAPLPEFHKHRIVFWHDEDSELFRADLSYAQDHEVVCQFS